VIAQIIRGIDGLPRQQMVAHETRDSASGAQERHNATTPASRIARHHHRRGCPSRSMIQQRDDPSIHSTTKPSLRTNKTRKTSHHAHQIKPTSNTRQTNQPAQNPNPQKIYMATTIGNRAIAMDGRQRVLSATRTCKTGPQAKGK